MISCVERRSGISNAAHPVEWLSDNGSAYIAKDTLDTATALGLKLCFTPVRSPQSNGIAEAFVKTFKRDYARLSILPDGKTVIALLPAWFADYNEVHPLSDLKFLSPREFAPQCLAQSATCPVKRRAHHRFGNEHATGDTAFRVELFAYIRPPACRVSLTESA